MNRISQAMISHLKGGLRDGRLSLGISCPKGSLPRDRRLLAWLTLSHVLVSRLSLRQTVTWIANVGAGLDREVLVRARCVGANVTPALLGSLALCCAPPG